MNSMKAQLRSMVILFLAFLMAPAFAQNKVEILIPPDCASPKPNSDEDKPLESDVEANSSLHGIGTKFKIELTSAVNCNSVHEEQEFTAKTMGKLRIVDLDDKAITVPAGAKVKGRIATKSPVTHGSIALIFDTLSTPRGQLIMGNANVISQNEKVNVQRSSKNFSIHCQVFPGVPPGSTVSTAIGAVAAPADGRDLIYGFYGGALGNPFRTFIVLKNADLLPGDLLELNVDYFSKLRFKHH